MPGIQLINNQPVTFNESIDDCAFPNNTVYRQLVNAGDQTQFQVGLSLCNDAAELLPDPGFDSDPEDENWILPGGYTVGDSRMCRDDTEGSDCAESALTVISATGMYHIEIAVESGCANIGLVGPDASWFSGSLGPGVHEFDFFFYDTIGILNLCLCPNSCLSSVSLKKILLPRVSLFTEGGTWVHTWNGEDAADPDPVFTFSEGSMTFTLDWAELELTEGCFYICLIDPCDNTNGQNSSNLIIDGDFGSESGWTITVNASTSLNISAGVAAYSSTNDSGTCQLENDAVLVDGLCYDVSFQIKAIESPASPVNTRVRFTAGAFIGTWRSTAGTWTESFTSDGSPVIMQFESIGSGTHLMTIDNVVLVVGDSCLVSEFCSNVFMLGDHSCTHLINACNNENGMGFVFGSSGFSPRIRLRSWFVRATYKAERDQFENSAGKKSVQYFKRRKAKALRIDPVPEYVHDFLSTLMGYDHVWIGPLEYFVDDDEYTPSYATRNDIMASVIINLSEKIQLVENTNCGAEDNICAIDATGYLGDPSDSQFVLGDPQGDCLNVPQ